MITLITPNFKIFFLKKRWGGKYLYIGKLKVLVLYLFLTYTFIGAFCPFIFNKGDRK